MGSLEPVYIRAQNWTQLAQSNIRSLKMYHWVYVILANFLYQILYTYDYVGTLSKLSEESHVRFQSLL